MNVLLGAALSAVFSINALAANDMEQQESFSADCKRYAQEEGVPAEEMESYMSQCIQDLSAAASEDGAAESAEGASQE